MTTQSISNFLQPGKGEVQNVEPLTHVKPMTSQEFWGRIANSSQVRVVYLPGQIEVYRGEKRVARWLPYPQILHYIPQDPAGVTTDDAGRVTITPPTCPTCNLHQMVLYRNGGDRSFFWGCPGQWGPRRCEGTINVVARSIDELAALADYLVETHSRQVEEGKRRRYSRIFGANGRGGGR